jgi:hypothetical protein
MVGKDRPSTRQILARILDEPITMMVNGQKKTVCLTEAVFRVVLSKAVKGDAAARRLLFRLKSVLGLDDPASKYSSLAEPEVKELFEAVRQDMKTFEAKHDDGPRLTQLKPSMMARPISID